LLTPLIVALTTILTSVAARTLDVLPWVPGGPLRLQSDSERGTVLRLEASDDLATWTETARLHDAVLAFPAPGFAGRERRHYRIISAPRVPNDDW